MLINFTQSSNSYVCRKNTSKSTKPVDLISPSGVPHICDVLSCRHLVLELAAQFISAVFATLFSVSFFASFRTCFHCHASWMTCSKQPQTITTEMNGVVFKANCRAASWPTADSPPARTTHVLLKLGHDMEQTCTLTTGQETPSSSGQPGPNSVKKSRTLNAIAQRRICPLMMTRFQQDVVGCHLSETYINRPEHIAYGTGGFQSAYPKA
jgi:hypothetical protein